MSVLEIKFDCPECAEGLTIDQRAIGHKVACPFCEKPILVPDVEPPSEVPIEPIGKRDTGVSSLEELAESRPAAPLAVDPSQEMPTGETKPAGGGLPAKRRPGEKPKAVADGLGSEAGSGRMPPPPPMQRPPGVAQPPAEESAPASTPSTPSTPLVSGLDGEIGNRASTNGGGAADGPPPGFEEKVRRTRKRRNPDEHRLNPREHPTMVAFDEVVTEDSFRKNPGHSKMPLRKKLGIAIAVLGTLGGIALGIIKKRQLAEDDPSQREPVLTGIDKEVQIARDLLDEFLEANSVEEKLNYLRVPDESARPPEYPPFIDRINAYYARHIGSSSSNLKTAGSKMIKVGELEFLRVPMFTKGVRTHAYFQKTEKGYKLDWDSFVAYNPLSLTTFVVDPKNVSDTNVFRLMVEPAEIYTGLFQDTNRFRSYRVSDVALGHSSTAIAYASKKSPAEEGMEKEFEELKQIEKKMIWVTVEASLVGRSPTGEFLLKIEKLLSPSWLLP